MFYYLSHLFFAASIPEWEDMAADYVTTQPTNILNIVKYYRGRASRARIEASAFAREVEEPTVRPVSLLMIL